MSAFLLAELGDKTILGTVTLAADNDWVGVWIGSTWSPPTRSPSWSGRSRASTLPSGSSSTAVALFLAFGLSEALGDYLEDMIARRRRTLTGDLISELIRGEDEGGKLDHDELL